MYPNLYSKFLIWWPIDLRTLGFFLFWSTNICWPPSRGGQHPKKWNFKVLGITCCGYSTLVSRDTWHNAKGISSIRSPCPEKTAKTCRNIGIFCHWPEMAKSDHILDVFSLPGDWIELIPFAWCQASRDTSVEYPQHIIPRTLKFHFWGGWPPLEGGQQIFFDQNKKIPSVLRSIGHHIRNLL